MDAAPEDGAVSVGNVIAERVQPGRHAEHGVPIAEVVKGLPDPKKDVPFDGEAWMASEQGEGLSAVHDGPLRIVLVGGVGQHGEPLSTGRSLQPYGETVGARLSIGGKAASRSQCPEDDERRGSVPPGV